jgi:tetratricopeptide (TPR) repeat protein
VAKKKNQKGRSRKGGAASSRLGARLREVRAMLDQGDWVQADDRLLELDEQYGGPSEVLELRYLVAAQLKDLRIKEWLAERIRAQNPHSPEWQLQLAVTYLEQGRHALALRGFQTFLERWPSHPEAAMARRAVDHLELILQEELAEKGLAGENASQCAIWHEELQVQMQRGEHEEALRTADRLIQARPRFAPGYNNRSEIQARMGNLAGATESSRQVLAFEPDNIYARANLARYLCLNGRFAEAKEAAAPLRHVTPPYPELWVKVAEAMATLGNDAGMLRAAQEGLKSAADLPSRSAALLEHLAGVAESHLGHEEQARRHWQQALRYQPTFEVARDNLEDLRHPVGERHGAWAFTLEHWVPKVFGDRLIELFEVGKRRLSDEEIRERARQLLAEHPEAEKVVPALLDRGDPGTRGWALSLAKFARTPFLLEALRDFALGQRGSDVERMQAAQIASDEGLLPSGLVRFWGQGEWRDVRLCLFEVSGEARNRHPREVMELLSRVHPLLNQGQGAEAEPILRQALELAPDAPDILNNLGVALVQQGREDEALELLAQIFARHPDYLFARITRVRQLILEGRLDEANELLRPLSERRKFHVSEFSALAAAEIDFQLARGSHEGAVEWLKMWEQLVPGLPEHRDWRQRVNEAAR